MSDAYNPQLEADEYSGALPDHKVPLTGMIKGPAYGEVEKGQAEQSSNKDIMEG